MATPVISLLAFVDSEFDQETVDSLRGLADRLRDGHRWVLGPPQFVDETDEHGVRTVGLVHRVYAAFDDAGAILDESIDRKQLDEVTALISELEALSATSHVDLGLELDGGSVGWIEEGEMTNDLRVGLLEAWASRFA